MPPTPTLTAADYDRRWQRAEVNRAAAADVRTEQPPRPAEYQPGYVYLLESVTLPIVRPDGHRGYGVYDVHVVPFGERDEYTRPGYDYHGCTWYVLPVDLPEGYALRRSWPAYVQDTIEALYPETAGDGSEY